MNDIKKNIIKYNNILDKTQKELTKYNYIINKINNNYDNDDFIPTFINNDFVKLDKNNEFIQSKMNNINNILSNISNNIKIYNKENEELKLLLKLLIPLYNELPINIHIYMNNIYNLETLQILRNHFDPVTEEFIPSISDIKDGVVNALSGPFNAVGNSLKTGFDATVKPLLSKIDNSLKDVGVNMGKEFGKMTNYLADTKRISSDISGLLSKISKGAENAIDSVKKFDFEGKASVITKPFLNFFKENFGDIGKFFTNIGDKMVSGFNTVIDALKVAGKWIYEISIKIGEWGKTFFDKYLKPFFIEMFGVMKDLFLFIWESVVPLLKKLIKFIVVDLPKYIKNTLLDLNEFRKKFSRAPLVISIITIITFIGIQVILTKILNTQNTIPHLLLMYFTATIVLDQVNNNFKNILIIQEYLYIYVIYFFKINYIRQMFKLSNNFGNDYYESIDELSNIYYKNKTKIYILILIFLIIIKMFLKRYINTFFYRI